MSPPPSPPQTRPTTLSESELGRYAWQIPVGGFGIEGQQRLKRATVLISRLGGVGGTAALELAAAGIGRLILAHGGVLRIDDLNRQLLMTTDWVGRPRIESVARRIRDLNPEVEIVAEPANIQEHNVARLAAEADLIVDAAPLFEERFLLNRESVRRGIPMVEAAMFEMELYVTSFLPGTTGCLRCLCREQPDWWQRRFPVFGAVAGTAGCLAAAEAIKILGGFGRPLAGRLLQLDLAIGYSKILPLAKHPDCPECGIVVAS